MGDTGSEKGEGVEALRLDGLLGGATGLCDIPQDDGVAYDAGGFRGTAPGAACGFGGGLVIVVVQSDGGDVEIDEAVLWVEDLHVAGDDRLGLGKGGPVEAGDALGEGASHAIVAGEAEELAGGVVEEGDIAQGVGDDDALVDGVEDGLEEALFACETQEVVLDFLGADAADALDEFFQEAGGHGGGIMKDEL